MIKFIVEQFSEVIEKNKISFNIISDLFKIINETIAKLLTKDNKTIDLDLIFSSLAPKFLKILTEIVDDKNESGILEFINNLFEEDGNQQKLIYKFILEENEKNSEVYLSRLEKTIANRIKFPELKISFSTIISLFFNLTKGVELLKSFLKVIIKPLAILLKNNENKESAKKALFRISSLYSYIYYKYVPFTTGLLGGIINFFNPFDPETLLKNLIMETSKDNTLDEILGKKESGSWFSSGSYKIISLIKEAAKEKESETTKRNELKNSLKKGAFKEKSNK